MKLLAIIIGLILGGMVAYMNAPDYQTPFISDLRLMVKVFAWK